MILGYFLAVRQYRRPLGKMDRIIGPIGFIPFGSPVTAGNYVNWWFRTSSGAVVLLLV